MFSSRDPATAYRSWYPALAISFFSCNLAPMPVYLRRKQGYGVVFIIPDCLLTAQKLESKLIQRCVWPRQRLRKRRAAACDADSCRWYRMTADGDPGDCEVSIGLLMQCAGPLQNRHVFVCHPRMVVGSRIQHAGRQSRLVIAPIWTKNVFIKRYAPLLAFVLWLSFHPPAPRRLCL
jgi:hypothetical protein